MKMTSGPPLIDVREASFGYAGRAVVGVHALTFGRGTCVGIFGPNGSGKTTLVRGVVGLLPPIGGRVTRSDERLGIGYLPQFRGVDLAWPISGFDAAALAVSAQTPFGWITGEARRRIEGAMARLGVLPLAGQPFASLSGGQQQRILLAGALATDPDLLVLDEPTDGLDVRSRAELLRLLAALKATGVCTALISHEIEDLLAVCDSVAWLHAAEVAGGTSRVEHLTPDVLADRITHGKAIR
ncbi:MAG TPA: ATP-binding cassette domain-containing protein [Tepidisphaeraceae bacterium]|jgi:ABC-type Mn2+/Zn2+ transport system ATPase subunit